MHRKQSMTKVIALSLTLLAAPVALAQSSTQRGVLSGTSGALSWTLYGPGQLQGLSNDARNTLQVSAPEGARVVGAKYENRTAILAYRADITLQGAFAQHDRELTRQGYRRTTQSTDANEARGQYQREDGQVSLRVQRQDNKVFRAEFDLSQAGRAAQGASQNTVAGTQTQQMTQTQGAQNQAQNQNQNNQAAQNQAQNQGSVDVLGVLAGRSNLSMFREAVERANLTNWLRGGSALTQDVTVFAPTNSAFEALPADQRNALLNNSQALYAVISYHLVGGKATADRLLERNTVTTLEGSGYRVTGNANQLRVGNASVVQANLDASNGVVHVIDRLLIPEDVDLAQLARNADSSGAGTTTSNQTGQNQAGTSPANQTALFGYDYNNLRYDFYGPNVVRDVAPYQNRVLIATPDSAAELEQPRRQNNAASVAFVSREDLRRVFEFYDRQFRQQNFRQVEGRLRQNDSRIEAVYARNNDRVGLVVNRTSTGAERNRYEVTINNTP